MFLNDQMENFLLPDKYHCNTLILPVHLVHAPCFCWIRVACLLLYLCKDFFWVIFMFFVACVWFPCLVFTIKKIFRILVPFLHKFSLKENKRRDTDFSIGTRRICNFLQFCAYFFYIVLSESFLVYINLWQNKILWYR